MARQILYTTVLLLASWSGEVHSQGFNAGSCVNLQPTSGNIQQGQAPFFVASTATSYTPGVTTPIQVFLASVGPVTASAVVLQARRAGSTNTAPVGTFVLPGGGLYQSLACGTSPDGTIVSVNANPKNLNLQFMWIPPVTAVGNVEFIASLVDTQNRAWIGVTSNPLTGPDEQVPQDPLTIDNCPVPTVSATGVVNYQPPLCRRGGAPVGTATCTPSSGTTLQPGVTPLTCTCSNNGETESCTGTVTFTQAQQGCNPNPCSNGGNCIPVPQLPSGFFCNCLAGFTGDTCGTGAGPGPLLITPCPPNLNNFGNTFVWTPPSCTIDGNVNGVAVCNPPSGTTFSGAINPVTCTCQAGDETATCPFNINAQPVGPACTGNPCGGALECRELGSALAGYTCHSSTGTPCP